jgi:hypothetical protein
MKKVSRESEELREFLDAEVQLKKLLVKLDFSDEDITRAAVETPSLYLSAGRFRVQKMRLRLKALHRLDIAAAEAGLRIRKEKDSKGKKLYTEPQVKEKIVLSPEVRMKRKRLDRAYEEEEFGKLLVDAFRYRKDVVRMIVDGNLAEGAGELRNAKENMVRSDMKEMGKKVRNKYRRTYQDEDDE